MSSKNSGQEEEMEIKRLLLENKQIELGFEKAYRLYGVRLYWHVRKLVLVHSDADDVIQNTWIKVYKNIAKFNWDASLYTWLYRIATNEALNFLKKKRTRFGNEANYQKDLKSRMYSDPNFDESQATRMLEAAIEQLSDKERLVFNLRYYDEMPYEQIAELTDGSVSTLKVQFHNAKKKITNIIQNTA